MQLVRERALPAFAAPCWLIPTRLADDRQSRYPPGRNAHVKLFIPYLHQHRLLAVAEGNGRQHAHLAAAARLQAVEPTQQHREADDQPNYHGKPEDQPQQAAGIDFRRLLGGKGRQRRQQTDGKRRKAGAEATQAHHLSFFTRSAGLTTSVSRMPKRSLTTTTSPWAMRVPLTITSSGSPARRSSSTTEPWLSCSRLRMLIRVRPISID